MIVSESFHKSLIHIWKLAEAGLGDNPDDTDLKHCLTISQWLEHGIEVKMTDDEISAYLNDLQPGEQVVETGESCSPPSGTYGEVYVSQNKGLTFGSKCVRWTMPSGKMGTSVTWGARLLTDFTDKV